MVGAARARDVHGPHPRVVRADLRADLRGPVALRWSVVPPIPTLPAASSFGLRFHGAGGGALTVAAFLLLLLLWYLAEG